MPIHIPMLHFQVVPAIPASCERALYLHTSPNGMRRVMEFDPRTRCCAVLPSGPFTLSVRTVAEYLTSQDMIG